MLSKGEWSNRIVLHEEVKIDLDWKKKWDVLTSHHHLHAWY